MKIKFLLIAMLLIACGAETKKETISSSNNNNYTPSPYSMDLKYSMTGKVVDTVIYNAKSFQIIFTDSSSINLSSIKYNINYNVEKKDANYEN